MTIQGNTKEALSAIDSILHNPKDVKRLKKLENILKDHRYSLEKPSKVHRGVKDSSTYWRYTLTIFSDMCLGSELSDISL
jgi:hypothetical protein